MWWVAQLSLAAQFPYAEIDNGSIHAKVYLPDAKAGYYRATRFDWSGVIASLEYNGHNYYGPWFVRVDPAIHDFGYEGDHVIASPCAAATGPVEEFQTNRSALGWDEAKPGGTFIKIGVGILRRDGQKYDFVKLYPIVSTGSWTVDRHRDSVAFTQVLTDPSSGYGYTYSKVVSLVPGKPEMLLDHRLQNTGRRTIRSTVYNHNFLVLDEQPPGPDFAITVPFQIQPDRSATEGLVEARANRIIYKKVLSGREIGHLAMHGFGSTSADNDIRIENTRLGAGMRITGDRPLSDEGLWSIKTVLAVEPTLSMSIEPGREFTWKMSYEYYTKKLE
jgi:hypothetical protein